MQVSHQNVSDHLPSQPTSRLVGHEGPIRAVTFSHDGKYCVTAGHDRTIRLWNPTRIDPAYHAQQQQYGLKRKNLNSTTNNNTNNAFITNIQDIPHALPIQSYRDGHTHPVSSVDIDDSSTTLLSSSNKAMIVTDVITQKMKRRYQGHTGLINTVACSSGGNVFASGSYDGTIRIMDGRSFNTNPIQILDEATDSISCVKILEKGNEIAELCSVSVDGSIRTYDIRKGFMHVDTFDQEETSIVSIGFTSDWLCSTASSLNGAIYVMERETGELINTCYGGHVAGRYSLDCSVTADDQHIVSGSEDGSAVIYDFASGKVVQTLKGHQRPTCSVATHPSSEHSSAIITGSFDGEAVLWTNGNPIYLNNE